MIGAAAFLLNPRVLAVLALVAAVAFTHFMAFRKGKNDVRLEWAAATAAANEDARRLEQARQRRAEEAGRLAAAREDRLRAAADGARRAAGGLRDDLAALRARSQSRPASESITGVLGELLQSCAEEYQRVAEEADRATSEVKELRDAWPQ